MKDHLGSRREGEFEVHTVQVGPNSVRLGAHHFGVVGSTPPWFQSPEGDWTEDERELHDRYFTMLDGKFGALWHKHKVTPEAAHAATAQAMQAAEQLKETVAKHELVSGSLRERSAELESVEQKLVSKHGEVILLAEHAIKARSEADSALKIRDGFLEEADKRRLEALALEEELAQKRAALAETEQAFAAKAASLAELARMTVNVEAESLAPVAETKEK